MVRAQGKNVRQCGRSDRIQFEEKIHNKQNANFVEIKSQLAVGELRITF